MLRLICSRFCDSIMMPEMGSYGHVNKQRAQLQFLPYHEYIRVMQSSVRLEASDELQIVVGRIEEVRLGDKDWCACRVT